MAIHLFTFTRHASKRCDKIRFTRSLSSTLNAFEYRFLRVIDILNQPPAVIDVPRHVRTPSVPKLIQACRPSAVFRRIRAVIIDPFECQIFRPFSHILPKIQKIFSPRFTDCDASSAIFRKVPVFRVMAPLDHRLPNIISDRIRKAMPTIKRRIMAALALCRNAIYQMRGSNRIGRFTFQTHAEPHGVTTFRPRSSSAHKPRSKSLACQVYQFSHFVLVRRAIKRVQVGGCGDK